MKKVKMFSSGLTKFNVMNVNGCPWFFVKEICDIIGIKTINAVMSDIVKNEKANIIIAEGSDGTISQMLVNYNGLNKLLTYGGTSQSENVMKIVTDKVIPLLADITKCKKKDIEIEYKADISDDNEALDYDFGYW